MSWQSFAWQAYDDLVAFAAQRSERLTSFEDEIREIAEQSLASGDWTPLIEAASVLWMEIFESYSPTGDAASVMGLWLREIRESLDKTSEPDDPPSDAQVNRVVRWVANYTVNSATYFAGRDREDMRKTWLTMDDDRVRSIHREVDNVTVGIMDTFTVGGVHMHFPGEPVGSPEHWINCRCLLAISGGIEMGTKTQSFAAKAEGEIEQDDELVEVDIDDEDLVDDVTEIPWHGVLTVEGIDTGDKRRIAKNSLEFPVIDVNHTPPLMYQEYTDGVPHGKAVRVGRIDEIWREDNGEIRARGAFNLNVREANTAIDGIVFGGAAGVSVDLDSAELELEWPEGTEFAAEDDKPLMLPEPTQVVVKGRVRGATMVGFGAFIEGYIALGPDFDDETVTEPGDPEGDDVAEFRNVSSDERKRLAGEGKAMPDGSFPIANEEDLKNAIQAIGRAKDPAAARRHIIKRARALGREDLIPDTWDVHEAIVASAEFAPGTKDGPGWITNPRATARLRKYWVRGAGRAKIRWGAPGDFNRCRRQLAKYVNPAFLAGTCANLHKEAVGTWPGRERGDKHSMGDLPTWSILASAEEHDGLPRAWFRDPEFEQVTPLTIEGRHIYGHLAQWGTCHVGIVQRCVMPPSSPTDYSYFHVGLTETDEGLVRTGVLVQGTGHANPRISAAAATKHYDDTGYAVADITVGEDAHGIWFSGALRDDVDEKDLKVLRASAVSGDWRDVQRTGDPNEMVGLLAVNVPGYPMPRYGMDGDRQVSLIASAGIVLPRKEEEMASNTWGTSVTSSFSINNPTTFRDADELAAIGRVVADELEYREQRKAKLASARDETLVNEAKERRAARIAEAKEGVL